VFPPSKAFEPFPIKVSKGYAPGRAARDKGKGISMPLYEHVFLSRQDVSAQQVE
jgi:hypothetical protein